MSGIRRILGIESNKNEKAVSFMGNAVGIVPNVEASKAVARIGVDSLPIHAKMKRKTTNKHSKNNTQIIDGNSKSNRGGYQKKKKDLHLKSIGQYASNGYFPTAAIRLFTGFHVIILLFLVIGKVRSQGIDHESEIVQIDQSEPDTCAKNAKNFFVDIDTTTLCEIYFCYPSQFDEKFKNSLLYPFKTKNFLEENIEEKQNNAMTKEKVTNACVSKCKQKKGAGAIDECQTWHGIGYNGDTVNFNVAISFSNEEFAINIKDVKIIRLHFGKDSKFFLVHTNVSGSTLKFNRNEPRTPPADILLGDKKIREAFMPENQGAWLVPLDMAHLGKGTNRSRQFFVFANCMEEQKPIIKYGKPEMKPSELTLNEKPIEKPTTDGFEAITTATAKVVKPKTKTTPKNPLPPNGTTTSEEIDSGSDETTTTERSVADICTTYSVNVKPSVIRDRFADLSTFCNVHNPENCKYYNAYAVRLGCLNCKEGITEEEQNTFLIALNDWVVGEKTSNLIGWEGTNLIKFKSDRTEEQQIHKISPGKYEYAKIPKEWVEGEVSNSVHVLLHECQDLGTFISAAKNDEVRKTTYEKYTDWSKDFIFLEDCIFMQKLILDEKYKISMTAKNRYSIRFYNKFFNLGVTNNEEPYQLTEQQIKAYMYKYGMTDPPREVDEFKGKEWEVNRLRANTFGRFFMPPILSTEPAKKHFFGQIAFWRVFYDLEEFHGELNKYSVEKASVRGTLKQMTIRCGDLRFQTARFLGSQAVSYEIRKDEQKTVVLKHQIIVYSYESLNYYPPRDLDEMNVYTFRKPN